jgi:hypothetical protein
MLGKKSILNKKTLLQQIFLIKIIKNKKYKFQNIEEVSNQLKNIEIIR